MALKIIVAATLNDVIGQKNGLPFKLADDMRRFKEKTVGHPVVSGSTTYFSIPAKFRPLRDRENIVLTRSPLKLRGEGVTIVTDFAEIIGRAKKEDLWIIGGAEIYQQALPAAEELHLTRVQAVVPGDVLFPKWDSSDWTLVSQESVAANEKNQYNFCCEVWKRR